MDSEEKQGNFEIPVVMLIQEADNPKGSVVQYDEYVSNTGTQTVSLYIIKSEAVGQDPAIAMKHYLIPLLTSVSEGFTVQNVI